MEQIKVLFLSCILMLFSCGRKVVAISENEQRVLDELAEEYNVSANIELDYDAINKGSDKGVYFVGLKFSKKDDFCLLDSIHRYRIMESTKDRIIPVISYPSNHSVIIINMDNMGDVKNGVQKANCIERYYIQLANDSIVEYYGEFENNVIHW